MNTTFHDQNNESEHSTEEPQSNVEVLPEKDETQALKEEVQKLKDQLLRAVADAENIRKRTTKEKEDAIKYGISQFSKDLLGVADNFERALSLANNKESLTPEVKSLIEGLEMVAKELSNIFTKNGIKQINPLGEPFDPNWHQAMLEIESTEYEAGMIGQVLQPGYQIHDRLLRPALVGVVKKS